MKQNEKKRRKKLLFVRLHIIGSCNRSVLGELSTSKKNWAGFLQARVGIYKGSVDSPGKKADWQGKVSTQGKMQELSEQTMENHDCFSLSKSVQIGV